MERMSFCLWRSSLIILLSTRASSPSTFSEAFGVRASRTKWLSQCGQYSSLPLVQQTSDQECGCGMRSGTYLSSNSRASLRKAFLHFLQTKTISKLCSSGWSAVSWWHSAQSNHFLQHGERMATWALRTCLLQSHQRRWCEGGVGGGRVRGLTYHMLAVVEVLREACEVPEVRGSVGRVA